MFGLGAVGETPYDLNFEVLGIPVRVHPAFWILPLAIGVPYVEYFGPVVLGVAALVVFVSLLVHELGHAVMQRYFGFRSEIVLYWLGGYARFDGRGSTHWWHQVLMIAAGPGAQLLLYAAVFALDAGLAETGRSPDRGTPADAALGLMLWINLVWALINLIPVYPLDGGQIARWLFVRFRPWDGIRLSLMLSIAAGAGFGFWMMSGGGSFFGLMLIFCAIQNFQELQGSGTRW